MTEPGPEHKVTPSFQAAKPLLRAVRRPHPHRERCGDRISAAARALWELEHGVPWCSTSAAAPALLKEELQHVAQSVASMGQPPQDVSAL